VPVIIDSLQRGKLIGNGRANGGRNKEGKISSAFERGVDSPKRQKKEEMYADEGGEPRRQTLGVARTEKIRLSRRRKIFWGQGSTS